MTDAHVVDRDRAATRWALYLTATGLALIAILHVIVGVWFGGSAGSTSATAGHGATFGAWIERVALVAVPLLAVVLGALLSVLVFRASSGPSAIQADTAVAAAASTATDDGLVSQSDSVLFARDLMEHVVDVEGVVLGDGAEVNSVPLSPLIDLLEEGQASRIPVFDSEGRGLYVLPGLTVYEFAFNAAVDAAVDGGGEAAVVVDEHDNSEIFHLLGDIENGDSDDSIDSDDETANQAADEAEDVNDDEPDPRSVVIDDILSGYTLGDLFEDKLNAERASSIAFVTMDASLDETISAMRDVEDMRSVTCSDAFVTRSGDPSEPVIGWITEAGIRRVMASMA